MSLTFRIALAAPDQDLVSILTAAEEPLATLGFRRERSFLRVEPERSDEEQTWEKVEVRSLAVDGQKLAGWNGVSVWWRRPKIEFAIKLFRWSDHLVNVYVSIDEHVLSHLFVQGVDTFYSALAILGAACKAVGGIGRLDLPIDRLRPDEVEPRFLGDPCLLGLFAVAAYSREQVEKLAADEYTVHELPGFWLLVDSDYVEISRKYA
ncbi:MAG TPA: hypothetical protein VJY33_03010 [Isosphaeraceae bacterium]|nr:hypothetical protein [Isosphaeraceae bacterium]